MKKELSLKAEALREEIKAMIKEAVLRRDSSQEQQMTVFTEDANGNKSYGGVKLAGKVSQLVKEMNTGEV